MRKKVADAEGLLGQIQELTAEARRLKSKAEGKGDLRTALSAIRELVRMVELLAKLRGELAPAPQQVNIALVPEWRVVMDRLGDFPEARVAVARALEEAS